MACNCGKRKIAVKPKKVVKTQPSTSTNQNNIKRIIRRAAR